MDAIDETNADLDRRIAMLGADHVDTLQTRSNLVALLVRAGRYDEAVDQARLLVDSRERVQGRDRSGTLKARRNLELALGLSGRVAEAREECRSLLPRCVRLLGAAHETTEQVRGDESRWLGQSQDDVSPLPRPTAESDDDTSALPSDGTPSGRPRSAGELIMEISHPELLAQLDAAHSACEAGDFESTLRLYDALLPDLVVAHKHRMRSPRVLRARMSRALCFVVLGRHDEALEALEGILPDAIATLGEEDALVRTAREMIERSLIATGQQRPSVRRFRTGFNAD